MRADARTSGRLVVDGDDCRLRRGNARPDRRLDLSHLTVEMPDQRGDRLTCRLDRAVRLVKQTGIAAYRRRHHLVDAKRGMVVRGAQQPAPPGGAGPEGL